jgi:ethanolamine ammonia-lyase small subunit
MLIGERPGLSSPDSLGIYLTFDPARGAHDAQRNCISNVRPEGLSYAQAADRLVFLMRGAVALGRSGVDLKDDSATVSAALSPHVDMRDGGYIMRCENLPLSASLINVMN